MQSTRKKLRMKNIRAQGRVVGCVTRGEVGKLFGISSARVYQIEMSALDKIRRHVQLDPEFRRMVQEVCGIEP